MFSLNDALFRTDDALTETIVVTPAVPPPYAARGFDHIGDIDVVDGVVYASLEQPDYELGTQAMAFYDAATLTFMDGVDVAQHHNSFVTVDPDSGIAYSMDMFGGQALLRYDTRDDWRVLAPIAMSTYVDKVQGGDVVGDAVWLSTDDETDGVYRVDLQTGAVQSLGSIGHADGEGEGIDATSLPSGDLHVLSADVRGGAGAPHRPRGHERIAEMTTLRPEPVRSPSSGCSDEVGGAPNISLRSATRTRSGRKDR